MSHTTDIYATGRKGDLRVQFAHGRKAGQERKQPVLVLSHVLRPEIEYVIYMDDMHQWDVRQEGNPRAAMLNAMEAAQILYGKGAGFIDRSHVMRVLDAVYEWTEDLLKKTPAPILTAKDVGAAFERDRVVVTAIHRGEREVILDAR